jgi:hypothetical protein
MSEKCLDNLHNRGKYIIITLILLFIPIVAMDLTAGPLIIDHTVVEKYKDIPQYSIDQVKKMWVTVPGESHSSGYRIGLNLLEELDSKFQVNIWESGTPEGQTDQYLRFSRATRGDVSGTNFWMYSYGEEDWYTNQVAINNTKAGISYCNTNGFILTAMGFGWCWDMTWHNSVGGIEDPVFRVRWAGSSVGGPDGDQRWGLDSDDSVLTENHICMDTYLQVTQEYIDYCILNGYQTKFFFTTGPIDGTSDEVAYQRYLKHEHIRNYVKASESEILFDYADILSWSDDGAQNTQSWTDYGGTSHTFQYIHTDNMLDLDETYTEDGDHIGQRGALRLGKAIWYMLARIAGWDGNPTVINEVSSTPVQFCLYQNYPNPFNPSTTIEFTLAEDGMTTLKIFDILGHEVITLVNEALKAGILHQITFDASKLTSGLYFYRLNSSNQTQLKRLLLMK